VPLQCVEGHNPIERARHLQFRFVQFVPRPFNRAVALVRVTSDGIGLRIESESGERMATRLRPMTLRDAFQQPRFWRRPGT
jgi:hypothetical protein